MGKALTDFALQLGQAGLGAAAGIFLGKQQDKRQLEQQKKLQALQIAGQKDMMDYSYSKQMEMWHNTNYKPQMDELRKAGLNPGLLYGMKGGGGTTTGSPGANVTGGTAAGHSGEPMGLISHALQLGILKAQKENIEADTKQKTAETTKTSGVDTKLGETQIANLTAVS